MGLITTMIKTYRANDLDRERLKKIQTKRLKRLINYVRENSLYFKDLYKDIGNDFCLKELPVTNKIKMMNNFDNWITDKNMSMKKI